MKPIISKYIQDARETIRKYTDEGDYEGAHGTEDDLFIATLRAIAAGKCNGDPQILAREALKSLEIQFQRRCA